jgi:hypothetical protein
MTVSFIINHIIMNVKLVFLLFFVAACGVKTSSQSAEGFSEQIESISIGYQNLRISKKLKRGGNDTDCADWTFTKESLKNLLKSLKKVSGQASYKSCYQYGCWYKGEVNNARQTYEITVYAGGYIHLANEKETLHFITVNESDLFVSICDCCETE